MTNTFNEKVSLRERCIRIKLNMDSTITNERGVGVLVGVGGQRRTRTTRKEKKKDTIRTKGTIKGRINTVQRTRRVIIIIGFVVKILE